MNLTALLCRAGVAGTCALSASLVLGQGGLTKITVQVDRPGVSISPMFYGLMTEEINHAYDGGLYGELIQNRSMRDRRTEIAHWSVVETEGGKGTISLNAGSPGDSAVSSIDLKINHADKQNPVGVMNDGYWGIPVRPHTTYRATFSAKASSGLTGPITVSIRSSGDNPITLSSAVVPHIGVDWQRYTVTLRTGAIAASTRNRFVISAVQPGSLALRDVSLFPPTFNNRPNGNRIDLMQMLGEMKPSFLRLPGGNYLEGDTIADRFNWKETIGDIWGRPGHQGPWGYRSSDGLGLLEFLEWCEDLHMQPLLAVYAGYSLRQQHVDPGPALAPYVQDALDEIEYVTGSTHTKWGAVRAQNGHPRPFPLTYIEIGNEDQFDRSRSYDGRFAQIYDAIKARWPNLQIIATMPVQSRKPDVVDDHYYRSADAMARDSGHYDRYPRTGPKIFVGEWASIGGNPTPTYREALGDAAWLTGLERNSDLVVMESYAPLLVNVNPGGAQWQTNLIGYDGLSSFGSPSYYVQSMFAKNTGNRVLPVKLALANRPAAAAPAPRGAVGLGTYRTNAEYKDIEVTANGKTLYHSDFTNGTNDWSLRAGTWAVAEGAIRQTSNRTDTHATAGDSAWTDYTYRVKARKLSGSEGFLILFHARNDADYLQWNVGGWGNTRSAIQRHEEGELDEIGEASNTTVETGRWYDVRIELRGVDIDCYLDGKRITHATMTPLPQVQPLYVAASAGSDGAIYLKVVNVSGSPESSELDFAGAEGIAPSAKGWELVGTPSDTNSVKNPKTVAPKAIEIEAGGNRFQYTFPAYSVTVLKLRKQG